MNNSEYHHCGSVTQHYQQQQHKQQHHAHNNNNNNEETMEYNFEIQKMSDDADAILESIRQEALSSQPSSPNRHHSSSRHGGGDDDMTDDGSMAEEWKKQMIAELMAAELVEIDDDDERDLVDDDDDDTDEFPSEEEEGTTKTCTTSTTCTASTTTSTTTTTPMTVVTLEEYSPTPLSSSSNGLYDDHHVYSDTPLRGGGVRRGRRVGSSIRRSFGRRRVGKRGDYYSYSPIVSSSSLSSGEGPHHWGEQETMAVTTVMTWWEMTLLVPTCIVGILVLLLLFSPTTHLLNEKGEMQMGLWRVIFIPPPSQLLESPKQMMEFSTTTSPLFTK